MYSPQLFEMLAPLTHEERLANAERKQLVFARVDDGLTARVSFTRLLDGGLVRAAIMLALRARLGRAPAHAD